jgi:exodeoxyribonuclease V alpha subunit
VHAYAVSIHKAQGSEYPAVVIPLLTEHAIMLYRQLLYTAVTRARRLCVLVGSRRAIEVALATNRGPNRYSALSTRLTALSE